jgi:hypothetical protein
MQVHNVDLWDFQILERATDALLNLFLFMSSFRAGKDLGADLEALSGVDGAEARLAGLWRVW